MKPQIRTVMVGGLAVTGTYWPERPASGPRNEPPDTPLEPAAFEADAVVLNGNNVIDQLANDVIVNIERQAVAELRGDLNE